MAVPAAQLLDRCFVSLSEWRGDGKKEEGGGVPLPCQDLLWDEEWHLAVSSKGSSFPLPFLIKGQSDYFSSVLFSAEGLLSAVLVCSSSTFVQTSLALGMCVQGVTIPA